MTLEDFNFIKSVKQKIDFILSGYNVAKFDELIELDKIAQRNGLHPTNFNCSGCKINLCQNIKELFDKEILETKKTINNG